MRQSDWADLAGSCSDQSALGFHDCVSPRMSAAAASIRHRTTSVNQRTACFFWTNHAARLRYMRKKNRALVPSMNLDTPHPMNAAAGLCVLLRALGPPICGAAPDLHTGWEKDSRGADLTASVDRPRDFVPPIPAMARATGWTRTVMPSLRLMDRAVRCPPAQQKGSRCEDLMVRERSSCHMSADLRDRSGGPHASTGESLVWKTIKVTGRDG
jgi:hypothetical protein